MSERHLQAHVSSDSEKVQLSPHGGMAAFSREHADGSYFLAHRPPAGSGIPFAHDAMLTKFGATYRFEMQIQVCLKAKPRGPLMIAGDLREVPMRLNLVTRSLCRVLLGLIKVQAAKRGVEFSFSFGDKDTFPHIAFPLLAADRIVVSDTPLPLPLHLDEESGGFRMQDGKYIPVDKSSLSLDAGTCVTLLLATAFVDFESWTLANIPGVGSLDLAQFWGAQPMNIFIYDQGASPADRRVFFDLELASAVGNAETRAELMAENKTPTPAMQPQVTEETSNTSAFSNTSEEDDINDTVYEAKVDALVEKPQVLDDEDGSESVYIPGGRDDDSKDSSDEFEDTLNAPTPGLERQVSEASAASRSADLRRDLDLSPMSPVAIRKPRFLDAKSAFAIHPTEGLEGSDDDINDPSYSAAMSRVGMSRQVSDIVERTLDLSGISTGPGATGYHSHSISIPWYFCNVAGDLWWCIDYNGRTCWRHHNQLHGLCLAMGAEMPNVGAESSVRDLEAARRVASGLLVQACSAEGLLEEFTFIEVNLDKLLSGEVELESQAMLVGIIEAEGRLVERCVRLRGDTLCWTVPRSRLRDRARRQKGKEVCVDLRGTGLSVSSIVGVDTVKLSTPTRHFVFIAKDEYHRCLIERSLDGGGLSGYRANIAAHTDKDRNKYAGYLGGFVSRMTAQVSALVPRRKGSKGHLKAPWKDMLTRWPANRIVVNDVEPFLESPPIDPLAFSADLLRSAVAAQGKSDSVVRDLSLRSGGLKRVYLGDLSPQNLWAFWVNIYHCLLVHAQLVAGRPNGIQQVVGFHNHVSYLVAGHVFSLVEIEHRVLRRHMTKPHIRFVKSIVRIWQRSDADLENRPCLAAPECSAACFACRPDWRLNLVLNSGNHGSADLLPVFEYSSEASFNQVVQQAMDRTIACCGRVSQSGIELPWTLSRYKDDAPLGKNPDETPERRWARALAPNALGGASKIAYSQIYGWKMRERLDFHPNAEPNAEPRNNIMSL